MLETRALHRIDIGFFNYLQVVVMPKKRLKTDKSYFRRVISLKLISHRIQMIRYRQTMMTTKVQTANEV